MKEEKRSVLQMPEDLIVDMNENLPGDLTMEDIQTVVKGKSFKVIFYMNEALLSTDFADMDLSVRSSNALKRAGYHTIGELIENIESFSELIEFLSKNNRYLNIKDYTNPRMLFDEIKDYFNK